jgi:hypothetical protein
MDVGCVPCGVQLKGRLPSMWSANDARPVPLGEFITVYNFPLQTTKAPEGAQVFVFIREMVEPRRIELLTS